MEASSAGSAEASWSTCASLAEELLDVLDAVADAGADVQGLVGDAAFPPVPVVLDSAHTSRLEWWGVLSACCQLALGLGIAACPAAASVAALRAHFLAPFEVEDLQHIARSARGMQATNAEQLGEQAAIATLWGCPNAAAGPLAAYLGAAGDQAGPWQLWAAAALQWPCPPWVPEQFSSDAKHLTSPVLSDMVLAQWAAAHSAWHSHADATLRQMERAGPDARVPAALLRVMLGQSSQAQALDIAVSAACGQHGADSLSRPAWFHATAAGLVYALPRADGVAVAPQVRPVLQAALAAEGGSELLSSSAGLVREVLQGTAAGKLSPLLELSVQCGAGIVGAALLDLLYVAELCRPEGYFSAWLVAGAGPGSAGSVAMPALPEPDQVCTVEVGCVAMCLPAEVNIVWEGLHPKEGMALGVATSAIIAAAGHADLPVSDPGIGSAPPPSPAALLLAGGLALAALAGAGGGAPVMTALRSAVAAWACVDDCVPARLGVASVLLEAFASAWPEQADMQALAQELVSSVAGDSSDIMSSAMSALASGLPYLSVNGAASSGARSLLPPAEPAAGHVWSGPAALEPLSRALRSASEVLATAGALGFGIAAAAAAGTSAGVSAAVCRWARAIRPAHGDAQLLRLIHAWFLRSDQSSGAGRALAGCAAGLAAEAALQFSQQPSAGHNDAIAHARDAAWACVHTLCAADAARLPIVADLFACAALPAGNQLGPVARAGAVQSVLSCTVHCTACTPAAKLAVALASVTTVPTQDLALVLGAVASGAIPGCPQLLASEMAALPASVAVWQSLPGCGPELGAWALQLGHALRVWQQPAWVYTAPGLALRLSTWARSQAQLGWSTAWATSSAAAGAPSVAQPVPFAVPSWQSGSTAMPASLRVCLQEPGVQRGQCLAQQALQSGCHAPAAAAPLHSAATTLHAAVGQHAALASALQGLAGVASQAAGCATLGVASIVVSSALAPHCQALSAWANMTSALRAVPASTDSPGQPRQAPGAPAAITPWSIRSAKFGLRSPGQDSSAASSPATPRARLWSPDTMGLRTPGHRPAAPGLQRSAVKTPAASFHQPEIWSALSGRTIGLASPAGWLDDDMDDGVLME